MVTYRTMDKNGANLFGALPQKGSTDTVATKLPWVAPTLRKQSVYETTNMMMAGASDGTSLS